MPRDTIKIGSLFMLLMLRITIKIGSLFMPRVTIKMGCCFSQTSFCATLFGW
jgi:hypothetical protein